MEINTIIHGDCLEKMKELDSNSVDTIITDPPYGLSFMGKKWDYDVPGIEVWQECLRVLKPGGTALIFAGSRTQHRMACNVEDAGFELFDVIQYLYGSGFPKSHNIGKSTKDEKWNGWGTQLKPAYEPILCCRKKTEGTYAHNALKWGVAGLNIDGGRIGYENEEDRGDINRFKEPMKTDGYRFSKKGFKPTVNPTGRFPANIILDEEAGKMLDEQSGELSSGSMKKSYEYTNNGNSLGKPTGSTKQIHESSKGGASRFFYCAKASKAERNAGCELFDVIQYLYGSGFPKSHNIGKSTKDEKWNGWGTQLKPAYEPILCCRKKTEGTYANNAIKWGVSGLNIDGSRIGYKDDADKKEAEYNHKGNERFKGEKQIFGSKLNKDLKVNFKEQGRFPANIILDEEAAKILDEHSGKLKSGGATYNKGTANCWLGGNKKTIVSTVKGDKGGASRFFYCAKASKAERNAGCEELFMLKEKVPEEDLKEIKHLLSI